MNSSLLSNVSFFVLAFATLPTQAQDSTDRLPSQIVEQFIAAYNAHDVSVMLSLVNPEIQWLSIEGDSIAVQANGADELANSLRAYFESSPSSRSTVESMMEADRYVSVWERAHWELRGEPASQSALAVYEIENGRISRVWYYPAMK